MPNLQWEQGFLISTAYQQKSNREEKSLKVNDWGLWNLQDTQKEQGFSHCFRIWLDIPGERVVHKTQVPASNCFLLIIFPFLGTVQLWIKNSLIFHWDIMWILFRKDGWGGIKKMQRRNIFFLVSYHYHHQIPTYTHKEYMPMVWEITWSIPFTVFFSSLYRLLEEEYIRALDYLDPVALYTENSIFRGNPGLNRIRRESSRKVLKLVWTFDFRSEG